jgi:uncharacterized protein
MTGKANSAPEGSGDVAVPRLIADEMLGRLSRYLRMLGCDTLYARGWTDDEIVRTARADGRVVLTRDRQLAARLDAVILLRSIDLPGQFRELGAAMPKLPRSVSFERCTVCNGVLQPASPYVPTDDPSGQRAATEPSGIPVFECVDCRHRYWEGTHTSAVRRHVAEWIPEAAA